MTTASYSARRGRVCRPSFSASVRSGGRASSVPSARRSSGRLRIGRSAPPHAASAFAASGRTQSCAIWLRARSGARRRTPGSQRSPSSATCAFGACIATPCRPPMRSRASAPSFSATSGAAAGDGEVVLRLDAHHARRLRGPVGAGERRRERQRHLAEDLAGRAPAERALDAVERLDDLDPARQHGEERALAALVDGELAGAQAHVGGGPHQPLERALGQVENSGTARTSSIVSMNPVLRRSPAIGRIGRRRLLR
jgi:hypothetical protein